MHQVFPVFQEPGDLPTPLSHAGCFPVQMALPSVQLTVPLQASYATVWRDRQQVSTENTCVRQAGGCDIPRGSGCLLRENTGLAALATVTYHC